MDNKENIKKISKVYEAAENFVNALAYYCDIPSDDYNIVETSERYAKMFVNELLVGYRDDPKKYIKTFEGVNISKQPLIIDNIPIKSQCSHHIMPFFGAAKIIIKYKEGASVLGLSKYYRIVNSFCRKLQLQEKLTQEIADFLMDNLEVEGLIIMITAQHMCVSMRGANVVENEVKSIAYRGCYDSDLINQKIINNLI